MCVLVCLLTCPAAARAQSCWPVELQVAIRDAAGRRIDPAILDSIVESSPDEAERLHPARRPPSGAKVLRLSRSGCRLRVDRITLFRGRRTMHLDFGIVLDSERRRGPSTFLIETPPLQTGTFRLQWDDTERGGTSEAPQRVPAERWQRVP
jgi:hypothetical protein